MTPEAARAFLARLGAQAEDVEDIGFAALAFAVIDRPDADVAAARAHLDQLAAEAPALEAAPAEERAGALALLLAGRHGYAGDRATYDDPANANLLSVIERRRGLPVALGILWLHAARAAGFAAWGIDFPGHFLVGVGGGGRTVTVDPFDGGALRTGEALAALLERVGGPWEGLGDPLQRRMTNRDVLLRLQNNLRLRRAAAGDLAGALVAAQDMLRLAPGAGPLWREAAVLAERLDRHRDALAAWERAAALTGEDEAVAALARLRLRLN